MEIQILQANMKCVKKTVDNCLKSDTSEIFGTPNQLLQTLQR